MAGEPTKSRSIMIPAPVGGVNYIDPLSVLPITDARVLINYLVYPWGIIERSKEEAHLSNTYANARFYPFINDSIQKCLFYLNGDFYRLDSEVDTTPTAVTGIATRTGATPQVAYHNKNLFFFNNKEAPVKYDIAAGTIAVSSFTGPGSGGVDLGYGFTYKNRLYAFEKTDYNASAVPTRVWYAGVDAISGAMTSIDFASVFSESTSLNSGFSWSVNQGITSEELFCLVGDSGEMLVYSGDYPASPNWQLIARIQVPRPGNNDRVMKVGQETYLNTIRGLFPMTQLFASKVGTSLSASAITRKLGEINFDRFAKAYFSPFIFAREISSGSYGTGGASDVLYALNYETGAWSSLKFGATITDVACVGTSLLISHANGVTRVILPIRNHLMDCNGENAGTERSRCIWKTPFFDLGTTKRKRINRVKITGADMSLEQEMRTSCYIKEDNNDSLSDVTPPSTGVDTQVTAATDNFGMPLLLKSHELELRPPGSGTKVSFCFNKIPDGEINEIHGIIVEFEEGGVY